MSRAQLQFGSALPTMAQIACSTVTAQLFTASSVANLREIVAITAAAPVYISGSSTGTSTNSHAVPVNVPFRLGAPMMRGALWGVSTAACTVTTFSC